MKTMKILVTFFILTSFLMSCDRDLPFFEEIGFFKFCAKEGHNAPRVKPEVKMMTESNPWEFLVIFQRSKSQKTVILARVEVTGNNIKVLYAGITFDDASGGGYVGTYNGLTGKGSVELDEMTKKIYKRFFWR